MTSNQKNQNIRRLRTIQNFATERFIIICNKKVIFKLTCVDLNLEGKWLEWSEWSSCSATVGPGNQTRTRHCNNPELFINEIPCAQPEVENKPCAQGTHLLSWTEVLFQRNIT